MLQNAALLHCLSKAPGLPCRFAYPLNGFRAKMDMAILILPKKEQAVPHGEEQPVQ
jgi:hypothetical protein